MTIPRLIATLTLATTLSACSVTEGGLPTSGGSLFDNLKTATIDDARVAQELALHSGDISGARCWSTVVQVMEERGETTTVADAIGPLSAWQKARNVRIRVDDGLDERVRRDCAILVVDALRTGRKLIGRFVPGL